MSCTTRIVGYFRALCQYRKRFSISRLLNPISASLLYRRIVGSPAHVLLQHCTCKEVRVVQELVPQVPEGEKAVTPRVNPLATQFRGWWCELQWHGLSNCIPKTEVSLSCCVEIRHAFESHLHPLHTGLGIELGSKLDGAEEYVIIQSFIKSLSNMQSA